MQSELPLTLILSPLRAGRGEPERTLLGSLFGDPDMVPPKVPLALPKRERVRVRVHSSQLHSYGLAVTKASALAHAWRRAQDLPYIFMVIIFSS